MLLQSIVHLNPVLFLATARWGSRFSFLLIARTSSKKQASLFSLIFAEVSKNAQFHFNANSLPSLYSITRSWFRSHLFPTKTIGTALLCFVRQIFSYNFAHSSILEREVILYTSRKPLPSRIHWSCIELNSSWPAVSRMSSKAGEESIRICLRSALKSLWTRWNQSNWVILHVLCNTQSYALEWSSWNCKHLHESSIVGSYQSRKLSVTKRIVNADLPTPPPPSMTCDTWLRIGEWFDVRYVLVLCVFCVGSGHWARFDCRKE